MTAPRIADPPLTDLGKLQARLAGESIREEGITRLYGGPMLRTLQTAQIIGAALALSPHVFVDLHEWGGVWEPRADGNSVQRPGLTREEMSAMFPGFVLPAGRVLSLVLFCRDLEVRFPSPEHSARDGYYPSPDHFMWGGTEEFVVAKGSDWCAELARVFCALCELSGISARIVFALDGSDDGHVLAECHVGDEWMLVDPLAPKLYEDARLGRVGAARMHQLTGAEKRILTASAEDYYVHERLFRHLSVSSYSIRDAARYDYSLSRCNKYYRQRLSDSWNEAATRP